MAKSQINKMISFKKSIKRKVFNFAERYMGIHIMPVHFYSPIPSSQEISEYLFQKQHPCSGIDFNLETQFRYLNGVFSKYKSEYEPVANTGLAKVDAFVLYSMIREKKPKLMIEIGSGESTKISLKALSRNLETGSDYKFVAIEPYPRDYLAEMEDERFSLKKSKVQDVDSNFFSNADILFIDSSHVSKIGSDVNYEMLNILPIMKVGALIHWHDIMIPVDYPETWIRDEKLFWNETYMVQNFMMFNQSFRIIWASKYMQLNQSDKLRKAFPFFSSTDPEQQLSSFWIERIA